MENQMNSGMQSGIGMTPAPASAPKTGLIIGAVAVLIVGLLVGYLMGMSGSSKVAEITPPQMTQTPVVSASTTPMQEESTSTPIAVAQSKVYENDYMKITVPAGWTYSTTQSGAINIMKNGYILYINPRAGQASGVQGGRFGEIAQGAPSADAVEIGYYPDACSTPSKTSAGQYSRYDYYIDKTQNNLGFCASYPSDGSTAWYFSYLSKAGGYFNYTTAQQGTATGYVITMAYNSKDVNALPKKGSATLNAMLSEMTSIANTLQLKLEVAGNAKTFTDQFGHIRFQYPSNWTVTVNPNSPGDIHLKPTGQSSTSLYKDIAISITGHCMNTQCLSVFTLDQMVDLLLDGGRSDILGNANAKNVSGYEVKIPAITSNPARTGYMFIKGPDFVTISTDIYPTEMDKIVSTVELLTTKGFNDRFGE